MTDTAQGSAAATLARTKRIEIQHFADGGSVRRTTVKNFGKPTGAAAMLAQVPASHAGAKTMQHGGAVHGPGGPTSDKVPIWASAGEFMLPADTAAAVGKDKLQDLVDATHTPTNKAAEKMGRLARADGGLIDDQLGAVSRVGDSYSGGNVSGDVSINGQAPGGTVSTVDAFRAPPPPAAPPVLGAPAAMTPLAPKPAASPMATLPGAVSAPAATIPAAPAVAAPPPPAPLDYANRNAAFNSGAEARTAMMSAPGVRRSNLTAAPAAGTAAATLAARPVQSIAAYADGGEIDDPRKPLPTFASPDAAAQALAGMASDARSNLAAGVQMASLSPRAAAPAPYVAEIPRGRYESASPDAIAAPAAAPAPEASPAPVASPAPAPAVAPVAPVAAPAAPAPDLAAAVVPAMPQAQLATLPAARPNPLGGLADTNAQLASLQASNASIPQGGATLIDGAGADADRRAQFNEQANLGNALARTSWSPRRGTQVNDAAVAAALTPIDARARMAQVAAKEAGDTQRATIQERGADARARQALGVEQQRLALEGKKVTLDANRDDRAAAAAAPTLALAQRKATLQSVVADPNSTPAQRQAATQQIANMEGKEVTGNQPPAGYERTADGNLKFIKGGPADPDTPKGKGALTEDQAKSAGYAVRMENALKVIGDVEKTSPGAARPGVGTALINALPEGAANALRPESRQRVEAAQLDALDAALTLNTGAAYTKEQLHGLSRAYFAQPNDDDKTVIEKQNRLKSLIDTARLRAGASGSAMADTAVSKAAATAAQSLGTAPPPPTANASVATPADHAKLPAGATYIAPDGTTRRKS